MQKSADVSQKELGILAGRTYCKLSQVHGSWSYFIFQLEVYQKTVDYFKLFVALGKLFLYLKLFALIRKTYCLNEELHVQELNMTEIVSGKDMTKFNIFCKL